MAKLINLTYGYKERWFCSIFGSKTSAALGARPSKKRVNFDPRAIALSSHDDFCSFACSQACLEYIFTCLLNKPPERCSSRRPNSFLLRKFRIRLSQPGEGTGNKLHQCGLGTLDVFWHQSLIVVLVEQFVDRYNFLDIWISSKI